MYKYFRTGYNRAEFKIFQIKGKRDKSYEKEIKAVVSDTFLVIFCHNNTSGRSGYGERFYRRCSFDDFCPVFAFFHPSQEMQNGGYEL